MWSQAVGARLQLKPIRLTAASEEIVAMAGMLGSFAHGAERALRKMAGLRLSRVGQVLRT